MTVRETEERLVFYVSSSRLKDVEYRVDLPANGGASECACKDWATRRHLAIKAGEPIGTRATCCKHVMEARRIYLNARLAAVAQLETEP